MPDPSARRWISCSEAAEYLGLSENGVRKLINRGAIPAARVGRVIRIDLKELERKLERQIAEIGNITGYAR